MTAVSVSTVAVDGSGDKPLPSTSGKRGLRGAFLNIPYIGPVVTTATAFYDGNPTLVHPTLSAAPYGGGGAEDGGPYRDDDTYDPTGNTGGLAGGPSSSVTRPTGARGGGTATSFIGDGVPGGSDPGDDSGNVIDVTGRAQSTGKDRFGRTKGVANAGAGLGHLVYTNFDGRTTLDGDGGRSIGAAGRGTQTDPDAVGSNVNVTVPRMTIDTTATAGGVVGIATDAGSGVISCALHANDITDAGSPTVAGAAGVQIAIFKANTGDTTEDGTLVGLFNADAGTTTATVATVTAGDLVNVYVRRRYRVNRYIAKRTGPGVTNQAAVSTGITAYGYGPWSAVSARTVT